MRGESFVPVRHRGRSGPFRSPKLLLSGSARGVGDAVPGRARAGVAIAGDRVGRRESVRARHVLGGHMRGDIGGAPLGVHSWVVHFPQGEACERAEEAVAEWWEFEFGGFAQIQVSGRRQGSALGLGR